MPRLPLPPRAGFMFEGPPELPNVSVPPTVVLAAIGAAVPVATVDGTLVWPEPEPVMLPPPALLLPSLLLQAASAMALTATTAAPASLALPGLGTRDMTLLFLCTARCEFLDRGFSAWRPRV